MFCLGCGAEVQAGAAHCTVCGRQVSGMLADARWSGEQAKGAPAASFTPGAAAATVPRLMTRAAPVLTTPATPTPARSIPGGDPDAPGFPRDAVGRAVVLTVLA